MVRNIVDGLFAIACIAVSALAIVQLREKVTASAEPTATVDIPSPASEDVAFSAVDLRENPSQGSASAKIGIVEFVDFECPFCAAFSSKVYPELKPVVIDTARARRIVVHRPLAIHKQALGAAAAASCAQVEGKFWTLYDYFLSHQSSIGNMSLAQHAEAAGVKSAAFDTCMTAEPQRVHRDVETAETLLVRNTPTVMIGLIDARGFFVPKKRIEGLSDVSVYIEAIEAVAAMQM